MSDNHPAVGAAASTSLYRTFWRWHFYAGLFVLPFVLTLALSGSVFLFKPQIERWEERAYVALPGDHPVQPTQQVEAALAAFPGTHFHSYRLPAAPGDAAMVHLTSPDSAAMRDVFVSAQGQVLGSLDTDSRIVEVARRIHGQLLLGQRGSWLVELAACWAIVMVVTGLYLWWPRGRGAAGVIWPRRRWLLRDLHAVTGFWISTLALVLLLTGLPWTDVWGNAFRALRTEMGWVKGAPQWNAGGHEHASLDQPLAEDAGAEDAGAMHAGHDHQAMHAGSGAANDLSALDRVVTRAATERLAFPAMVLAPDAALFGSVSPDWVVTSLTQNRPQGMSITYARVSGDEVSRETFAARHPIDRIIGYGQAWHEGALFGAINQAIGVLTAAALVTLAVTGFLLWRRRRPRGVLGAPMQAAVRRVPSFVVIATLLLALLLPLLAASLLLLWMLDRLLPRVSPGAAAWLGISRPGPSAR